MSEQRRMGEFESHWFLKGVPTEYHDRFIHGEGICIDDMIAVATNNSAYWETRRWDTPPATEGTPP